VDSGVLPIDAGQYVLISVEDRGPGIQGHQLTRIFDPYFTTKPGHQGLGLASSHSVVRRHGGHLRAESVPGAGSIFHVYLPARAGVPVGEPPPPSEEYGGGGHILVMDDEPRLRELLTDCLVALKCRVRVAAHGDEAILHYREMLDHDPFDVVVLDLTIRGGKGGVETLRELQALDPQVRAIACSGYSNDPVMCDHARHGFAEALEKPFRFAMLARAVRKVMAQKPKAEPALVRSRTA
jgi:two-component system, cell cycle sensor histidine kinase and response regulator CckA